MIGIKPIGNERQWTNANEIYDKIDELYGDNLYLHTIHVDKSAHSPVDISRYDVVLAAIVDDTQFCVNDFIVSESLAELDENTKHHLRAVPNLLNDLDDSDWENEIDTNRQNSWPQSQPEPQPQPNGHGNENEREIMHSDFKDFDFENAYINFQEEDLLEMFPDYVQRKTSTTPNPGLQKIDEANEVDDDSFEINDPTEQAERQPDNGYVSAEPDGTDASSEHCDVNHPMEYVHKRPKVDWWQTKDQLILRIGAHDNVQYGLEITTDYLIYE